MHVRTHKSREPQDKESFGYILWLILGGKETDVTTAAQRLGIDQSHLSGIIHGTRKTFQIFLLKKQWREILSQNYPDTWRQYADAFETRAKALPYDRKNHVCRTPTDKESFGYALWLILGGKDADLKAAAAELNVSEFALKAIVYGKRNAFQDLLLKKHWREVLSRNHPDAWRQHAEIFEARAKALPRVNNKRRCYRPDNKESFGYILWLILGGNEADIRIAAAQLNVTQSTLSLIIHDRRSLSSEELVEKRWREILSLNYPEAWRENAEAFERYAGALSSEKRAICEPKNKESFGYALWLILGGEKADLLASAKQLHIAPTALRDLIGGEREITQRELIRDHWREKLALHYPEAWQMHAPVFEQRVKTLREAKPSRVTPPKDKNTFGYVLWCILGGNCICLKEASEHLNINEHFLRDIVTGRTATSRKTIDDKHWRAALAEHYPEAWATHFAAFEEQAATLSPGKKVVHPKGREPEDHESIGYALWLVIGGHDATVSAAARHLKINAKSLAGIIHGQKQMAIVAESDWPLILQKWYPEGWKKYGALFEERIKAIRKARSKRNPDSLSKTWDNAADVLMQAEARKPLKPVAPLALPDPPSSPSRNTESLKNTSRAVHCHDPA